MKLTCICAATACCLSFANAASAQQSQPTAQGSPATPAHPVPEAEPVVPGLAATEGEHQGGVKGFLSKINSEAEGWTPRAGSVVAGSGIALGAHYRRPLASQRLFFDAEYLGSIKGYQTTSFGLSTRPLASGRLTLGVGVTRDSLLEEDFYGLGPDSDPESHTSYTRVGTETGGWLGYRLAPGVDLKSTLGFVHTDLAAGHQSGIPTIGDRFTTASAAGMGRETNFIHAGVTLSVDRRDSPKLTRNGGYYQVGLQHFTGLGGGAADFIRVDLDARRYVPIRALSENDSIALRGRLSLTNASGDRAAPFYFLPRLGGSSLRGYDSSRFIDQHSAAVSVEYRWQVRRRLQFVSFVDAGQVAPSVDAFAAHRFQAAFGAGVRYRGFRLDYAVGREGSRVHVGFGPSF